MLRHVPYIGFKRKRPRLCAVCHRPNAQWAIAEQHPLIVIDTDSNVSRYENVKQTYYCARHIDSAV